jgi:hypothetical protein
MVITDSKTHDFNLALIDFPDIFLTKFDLRSNHRESGRPTLAGFAVSPTRSGRQTPQNPTGFATLWREVFSHAFR